MINTDCVEDQVWNKVLDQVWGQVRDQVCDQVRQQVLQGVNQVYWQVFELNYKVLKKVFR